MNARFTSSSQLISASRIKTPGHSLQQFNTYYHFEKFDIFFRKVTDTGKFIILRMWMNFSPSVNTTSIYLDAIFSLFNYSTKPLVNESSWFFTYLSCHLQQWISDSWFVPDWIHVFQLYLIWWRWVTFWTFYWWLCPMHPPHMLCHRPRCELHPAVWGCYQPS